MGNNMTREDILMAAAGVFRKKGFHAASMSDIAQTVNLQKASLYHHIDSKQDILMALLDRGLDLLMAQLAAVARPEDSASSRLKQSMVTYLETLVEHGDLAAVLLFEHRSLNRELRQRHFPRRDEFERLWREIIQDGIDAGEFVCPDPGLAAKYLLGVLNWTLTWYRSDGALSPAEIADHFGRLFLNGLVERP